MIDLKTRISSMSPEQLRTVHFRDLASECKVTVDEVEKAIRERLSTLYSEPAPPSQGNLGFTPACEERSTQRNLYDERPAFPPLPPKLGSHQLQAVVAVGGQLAAIKIDRDISVVGANRLVMNGSVSPSYLQSLGAYRLTDVKPLKGGPFEVTYAPPMRGTVLGDVGDLLAERQRAVATFPPERGTIDAPMFLPPGTVFASGEEVLKQIVVEIEVQTGEVGLRARYAAAVKSGSTNLSYQGWSHQRT